MSIELFLGLLSLAGVVGSALIADRRFAKQGAASQVALLLETLQCEQNSLRDDNRKLRAEVDALRSELAKAQNRITELESENAKLRGMLSDMGRL